MPSFLNHPRSPYILIVLAASLLYLRTLSFDFTYFDDDILILDNHEFLSDLSNLPEAFRHDVFINFGSDDFYRPMQTVYYMFVAQFGGKSPAWFHFANLLLHIAASCTLFYFLRLLGYAYLPVLLLSLLFTVHPALSQAVCWIPGVNDSLMALFALLSLVSLLHFTTGAVQKNYRWHILFFAAALFSKESAAALVPVYLILLYTRYREKIFPGMLTRLCAGWGGVAALWWLARTAALKNHSENAFYVPGMISSAAENLPGIVQYLGKMLFPFRLSVFPLMQDTSYAAGIIALILVVAAVVIVRARDYRRLLFGPAWLLLLFIPSLVRPNAGSFVESLQLEHRAYLPMMGFLIFILDTGLLKDFGRRVLHLTAGLGMTGLFFILAWRQSDHFRNKVAFWENAVATSPSSSMAHTNLAIIYQTTGQEQKAEPVYLKALELSPGENNVRYNLAMIYLNTGRAAMAEKELETIVRSDSNHISALFRLGNLYFGRNEAGKAEYCWTRVLRLEPRHADAYNNLAVLYLQGGNAGAARDLWKKAIENAPGYAPAYQNLVRYYSQRGDTANAMYYQSQLERNVPPDIRQ